MLAYQLSLGKSQSVAVSPQRFMTADLAGWQNQQQQKFNFAQKSSVNLDYAQELDPKISNAQNHIEQLDRLLLGGNGSLNGDNKSAKFGYSPSPHIIKSGNIKFKFDDIQIQKNRSPREIASDQNLKLIANQSQLQDHQHQKQSIPTNLLQLNQMNQISNLKANNQEQKYLPTDIKHLEHIIQYTQPNQMTQYGSVLCNRKQCLEDYHQNQQHQKHLQSLAKRRDLFSQDDPNQNPNNNNPSKQQEDISMGNFEEECENFMRNLHKYYEKFINNEHAFMQKSYLESNMFSNKRRTIENLIRNKQVEHGIIKGEGMMQSNTESEIQCQQEPLINSKEQLINKLIGQTPEEIKLQKEKELENPYAELFGVYDFRYYNSKLPAPPKEPLGKPSGRKEVQLLNDWFESMMEQYVYQQKDFLLRDDQRKKAFYYSKVILTICIRDIVRQVSVHCIERGAFMEKVLNIYLSIYEAELRTHLHDIDMQKEKHIEQIKNIREQTRLQMTNFEKTMDNLNVKIKELTQQRDRYQGETEKLKDAIAKLQRQDSYQYQQSQLRSGRSFGQTSWRGGSSAPAQVPRLLQQIGQRINDQFAGIQSPRKFLDLKSDFSSDNDEARRSDKNNLAMKKTRIANLAREGGIQRQQLAHKNSQKRIHIAESSDSILTEDEDKGKKKKRSQKGSSSSESAEYSFNDEGSHKLNTMDQMNTQTQDITALVKQSTLNMIKKSATRLLSSDALGDLINGINKRGSNEDIPEITINDEDKRMIKDAIDIIVDDQQQEPNDRGNQELDIIAEEVEDMIFNGNNSDQYSLKRIDSNRGSYLDQSLDQIEKEQRIRLIQSISEITSQLYGPDGKTLSDAEKIISQKDFVQKIVEQVMKNGQQTILKLLQRISDEDKLQLNRLLGDKKTLSQLQNDPFLGLAEILKTNQLTNTNFLKYAQKRNSNLNNVRRLMNKQQNNDEKGGNQDGGQSSNNTTRDTECQTEDFNFVDYDQLTVETAQIYMFDRVSRKLKKIVVDIDPTTGQKVFNQYEYSYKGHQVDMIIQLKSSITKRMEAEFKYKIDTKNKHYEINRANRTLKNILQKISELELETFALKVEKGKLSEIKIDTDLVPLQTIQNESIAFQSGFMKGFELARSQGYFKGYEEGKHFGHQLGFQDGAKEGWNFGFDDGYKNGIRRIFKECRDIGINIDQLDIMEFINKEDQYYGLKRYAFEKIFKIISKNEKLQLVYKLHEKFLTYNEKRKKQFAKMGRKNLIKMIAQLYQQMITSHANTQIPNYLGILEYMYDDFSKKYGNVKLAEKKIMQILGSTYYHIDSHPKITFFGLCLHLTKRGFSNDVLFFYLSTMEKIQSSNVGILIKQDDKSDIDIIPYLKALDGIKLVFEEKLPVEAYGRVRQEVDRFTITKERAKVVDLDKLLEHIILNYLRHAPLLITQMDQIYHAFTLYENYYMAYNELMMLVELADPERLRIDTENYKYIEIEKKEFISVFEKKKMELGDGINISLQQYREIFQSTNIVQCERLQQSFEESKKIVTVNQCKEMMEGLITDMKLLLDEIYAGQKWKNIKFLESRDVWTQRLQRLEKSLNVIHFQIIALAANMFFQILQVFHIKKRDLYGDGKDDDEDLDLLDLNGGEMTTAFDLGLNQLGLNTQGTANFNGNLLQSHTTFRLQTQRRPPKIQIFNPNTSSLASPSQRQINNQQQQQIVLQQDSSNKNNINNNRRTSKVATTPNDDQPLTTPQDAGKSPKAKSKSSDSEEDYLIEDLLDRQKRGNLVYNENFIQQVQNFSSTAQLQNSINPNMYNSGGGGGFSSVAGLIAGQPTASQIQQQQPLQANLHMPLHRQKSTVNSDKHALTSATKLGNQLPTNTLASASANKSPFVRQSSNIGKKKSTLKQKL